MGTSMRLTIDAVDRPTAVAASETAVRAVEAIEARLSTWRRDSELSRFNRSAPGSWVTLSAELERDLRQVRHWWRETDGAFDPGVASLVAAWDLRDRGRVPRAEELGAAREAARLHHLELGDRRARRDTAGFGIEEGGFGKGIALRDAARAALEAGARCVVLDLGGQLLVDGDCGSQTVAVAHPQRREEVVARIELRSGSVATSGNSERSLTVGGVALGHLLDPSTGRPAADWGSVTVLSEDAVAADCLATALYVMGPERGLRWASARADTEAVFARVHGGALELRATPELARRLAVVETPTARSAAAATANLYHE